MPLLVMRLVVTALVLLSSKGVQGVAGGEVDSESNLHRLGNNSCNKVVTCYYSNWAYWRSGDGKYTVEDIDLNVCTHLVYAFAVLDSTSYKIKAHDEYLDLSENYGIGNFKKFTNLKQQKAGLKTLLAIGGWTDSRGSYKYSDLVASQTRRRNFIDDVIPFLQKYDFDGLDLDWEYPSYEDGGRPQDKENFGIFVKELKTAFQSHNLMVTAAVGASEKLGNEGYDIPVLGQYLDFIHLMTYDYHGSWETQADHHSPLYKPENDINNFYSDFAVSFWINKGAPADKLVLGVPLYGRSFTLSTSKTIPPAPASGPGTAGTITNSAGFLSYLEICSKVQSGWTVVTDATGTMGPYAYSGQQWVGYDDVDMVRKKALYVKMRELGGAMVWALDLEDFRGSCNAGKYPLMKTLSSELLNSSSCAVTQGPRTEPGTPAPGTTTTPACQEGCAQSSTPAPTSTPTHAPTPTSHPTTQPPSGPCTQNFVCPGDGLWADPCDCQKFYQCHAGRAFHKTCPADTLWSQIMMYCDWAYNVICSITATTNANTTTLMTTTSSTAMPTTTTTATTTTALTFEKMCPGEVVYVQCSFRCPEGNLWSMELMKCVDESSPSAGCG
ncbi:Chitotriosidase-1-like 5 [Homarus americanus]|uniref:Chitotriosidase-1-like 5 n=1 Tax=Homarus americanus TaxID=6706 RepID=A0A8J5JB58_HOMAM|nr:Chitotriosidase-1-like 5 [Homarus americanus]